MNKNMSKRREGKDEFEGVFLIFILIAEKVHGLMKLKSKYNENQGFFQISKLQDSNLWEFGYHMLGGKSSMRVH